VFNLSDKPHGISFPSTKPSNASNLPSFSRYIMTDPDVEEHRRHLTFIDTSVHSDRDSDSQEIKSTPLFTSRVRSAIKNHEVGPERLGRPANIFPQYGLLGLRQCTYNHDGRTATTFGTEENMVYANMNEPWSTFICGSQGGGKSHTLSCLLENCLLSHSPVGMLPNPLAGIVFHYDKFTSAATTQLCEAAYLCSSGVPVRVLVSPSNYHNMVRLYSPSRTITPCTTTKSSAYVSTRAAAQCFQHVKLDGGFRWVKVGAFVPRGPSSNSSGHGGRATRKSRG
jgi:hypothetical protein